ncbi:MAG: metallophosphoesterase [Acidimicrobiales bacterium]
MAKTDRGRPETGSSCPDRPSSLDPAELGFTQQPMVRWLDPHQLLDTAVRVLLSGIFSSYADNRELQALVEADVVDRSHAPELWLDYVADLGDGWNPTYTVARLLATEELELDWDGTPHATERGRLLVMGGDQVYPVPKAAEYENRMLGPYRSALPCTSSDDGPELFAIPGSHDWYDGLVNFTNIFCRGRSIGGWRTGQQRSYFALKLPNHWWLWGIDVQFGAYLDEAQLKYFCDVAASQVADGDRIILCTAKEVGSGRSTDEIYSDRHIEYLERQVIEPAGARVMLYLKSGRHHYCRYEEADGDRHHITSGGGGAFLHPTHQLPDRTDVHGSGDDGAFQRAGTYPSPAESKRLRKRVWLLPFFNLPLAALFGTVQVLLAFMMGLHLRDRHASLDPDELARAVWESPTAFLLLLLMVVLLAAMVKFAHEASGITRVLLGLVHSAMQLASIAAVMIAASELSTTLVGPTGAESLVVFLAFVALLGGIGGTFGVSGYFWATNCLGLHGNEAYAPLHHQDLKHFLRLHFDGDGALTVYPVAVDRVGRHWEARPDAAVHEPWFAPTGSDPETHLIEEPIRIDGRSSG